MQIELNQLPTKTFFVEIKSLFEGLQPFKAKCIPDQHEGLLFGYHVKQIGGSKLSGYVPKHQMRKYIINEEYKIISEL